jgi:hypothetical protein
MIQLFFFSLLISISAFAVEDKLSTFGGRVSAINTQAELVRVKTDFKNMKFLNKKDKIDFWNETNPQNKCQSYIVAKSNDYTLLKVPNFNACITKVHITTGSWLYFESADLDKNLVIAKELVSILVKKKTALDARLDRNKKELATYTDKVEAVNKRYLVLREKLELEWRKELTDLEEDKVMTQKTFQETQARVDDINHKLEQYRVYDTNLEEDRWSLDNKLYYKK